MKDESRDRAVVVGGYLWLAFVGLCVVTMSWTGLVGFGEEILGLGKWAARMVPISLDGMAITLGFFALRSVVAGDAGGWPRILAVVVVCASAGFNVYHALATQEGLAAAAFFGGMSIAVYMLFDVVLRQVRRELLRQRGAIEAPLPRFRFARWAIAPRETFRAWKVAVRQGITDPGEALQASLTRPELVEQQDDRPELEVKEVRTERTITARNGTQAARIRELYEQGMDKDAIVAETGYSPETVRVNIKRIEQRRPGGAP